MPLGDVSGVSAADAYSGRLRQSLLSELSLSDLLGGLDATQSVATSMPAGLYALPLLARIRTGVMGPSGGGARIRIPETAVFGLNESDPSGSAWMTTGQRGTVETQRDVDDHDVIVALGRDMDHDNADDPNGFVAVVRTPQNDGTEVRLVTAADLKEVLSRRGGGAFAVQRLIRPAHHRSAFKNRTRWRKAGNPEAWIVTNGLPVTDTHSGTPGGFLTDAEGADILHTTPCSIVHARGGGAVSETAAMCAQLADHIEATVRPLQRVHELVADFTRDEAGLWYLLQIKAVVTTPASAGIMPGSPNALLRPVTAPVSRATAISASVSAAEQAPPVERPTATHTVLCNCCGRRHPPASLAQTLTQRMIRSMRMLQRARGITLSWHRHFTAPEEIPDGPGRPKDKIDDKYQGLRVCAVCYDIYKAEKKLELASRKFSKRLGVTPDDTEGEAVNEWRAEAVVMADEEIQAAGEAGEGAGVEEAAKHAPLEADERDELEGWRLLVALHELRGQTDTLELLGLNKPGHTLTFSCLGVDVEIDLKTAVSVTSKPGGPSSSLSPSSASAANVAEEEEQDAGHSAGRHRVRSLHMTTSGKIVMPGTGGGRSAVMMNWHRVFPFFCKRDDPAEGGLSNLQETMEAERSRSGDADASSASTTAGSAKEGSGMLHLRAAVHELAAVVLTLRCPKGRHRVIAEGYLPLGHLGVERPPELREQFVSLKISSDALLRKGGMGATTKAHGGGLVLRLAVGLMRTERVGMELIPLRPLKQTDHFEKAEEDDDDFDDDFPASVINTELEKLASTWGVLDDLDETAAVKRFRFDTSEIIAEESYYGSVSPNLRSKSSPTHGSLLRSKSRTSLPAPAANVLLSVDESEFMVWWRRKMMNKERDRRHGAVYVPPPWHCGVDPVPGSWLRVLAPAKARKPWEHRAGLDLKARSPGANHTVDSDGLISLAESVPRRKRRARRKRKAKKKRGAGAVKSLGTDPSESATGEQEPEPGPEEAGNGEEESSEDEGDELEMASPVSALGSGDVELADENSVSSIAASRDETAADAYAVLAHDDTVKLALGQRVGGGGKGRASGKGRGKGTRASSARRRTKRGGPLAAKRTAKDIVDKLSGAGARDLIYWNISVAVHGLPASPEQEDDLILVGEMLGSRIVLKTEDELDDEARLPTQGEASISDVARVGSVVVYGSMVELERLLNTPRRGALRGAAATCGELRLTLCARHGWSLARSPESSGFSEEAGESLLREAPWGSTSSIGLSGGEDSPGSQRRRVMVVGGGAIGLGKLIPSGGELLQSVTIRGPDTGSGKLQVGVWCDPVHSPSADMRPSRPIALGESSVCAVSYDALLSNKEKAKVFVREKAEVYKTAAVKQGVTFS